MFRHISALLLNLDTGIKMNSRGDEVKMFCDVGWDTVFITSHVIRSGLDVGVRVVLCSKKRLGFIYRDIDFYPIATFGQSDSMLFDAARREPGLNSRNRLGRRSKYVCYLLISAGILRSPILYILCPLTNAFHSWHFRGGIYPLESHSPCR